MRNYAILIAIAIVFAITPALQAQTDYDAKALKSELYQLLKPNYRYVPSFPHFTTIYIDYIIPAVTDENLIGKKGCIVFLMGYKVG